MKRRRFLKSILLFLTMGCVRVAKAAYTRVKHGVVCNSCPKNYSCCNECAKHKGHYSSKERSRFTDEENALIDSGWNDKTGFLGDNGCRTKDRKLRSITCLWENCGRPIYEK